MSAGFSRAPQVEHWDCAARAGLAEPPTVREPDSGPQACAPAPRGGQEGLGGASCAQGGPGWEPRQTAAAFAGEQP